MVLWYYGIMVLWYYGIMVLWYYGIMVLWYYGSENFGLVRCLRKNTANATNAAFYTSLCKIIRLHEISKM
jgi:hypothetical protein